MSGPTAPASAWLGERVRMEDLTGVSAVITGVLLAKVQRK